jgi:hypothetical protein
MAAGLESLYALYNPLWLRGTAGSQSNLFTAVVTHLTARSTYELTEAGLIQSVLTKGQNKLFKLLHEKHPGSFPPGRFASCDYFLEVSLDISTNLSEALQTIFAVGETRNLKCKVHLDNLQTKFWSRKTRQCFTIHKDMYDLNSIPYGHVAKLIDQWTSEGLQTSPGLYCRACQDNPKIQAPSPLSGEVRLELADCQPPPHLLSANN